MCRQIRGSLYGMFGIDVVGWRACCYALLFYALNPKWGIKHLQSGHFLKRVHSGVADFNLLSFSLCGTQALYQTLSNRNWSTTFESKEIYNINPRWYRCMTTLWNVLDVTKQKINSDGNIYIPVLTCHWSLTLICFFLPMLLDNYFHRFVFFIPEIQGRPNLALVCFKMYFWIIILFLKKTFLEWDVISIPSKLLAQIFPHTALLHLGVDFLERER